ncbi:TIGR02611 family protein [Knoellia aerolata]|uniref:TIGR02611 family protein n=1 Tax=Knoellia aerolata TaxID=442954 RepID=UPI000561A1F0|nr:TIGR02611 family protein [Knoellia aerolata]
MSQNLDREAAVATKDDWAWRRRIRANPATARVYRIGVFVVGLVVVCGGLLLIPFPGPGWLIVIAGLAIWSTEFERAQRVLEFVKRHLRLWEEWVKRQNPVVKALVGVVGIAFIATVLWLTFHFSGIPGFFPDGLESWMRNTARI